MSPVLGNFMLYSFKKKKNLMRAGEMMALQFGVQGALAEKLSLVPSTHTAVQPLVIPVPRNPMSPRLCGLWHAHGTGNSCNTHIHVNNENEKVFIFGYNIHTI